MRETRGITLIVLIITIIVLLIIAGITLAILSGENGILKRASEAKQSTERTNIIESAKIDILNVQADNQVANITKKQLKDILEKYFISVPEENEMPDDLSTLELKTKVEYGNHEINISDIYNENFLLKEENETKELVLFDYKNGGLKYDFIPNFGSSYYHTIITDLEIYGQCTSYYGIPWGEYKTVQTFDISEYDYLYFECKIAQKYGTSQMIIGTYDFRSLYEKPFKIYSSSEYTSYYLDIKGNNLTSTVLRLGVKMSEDYIRYVKYTNQKPEGTYLGSISEL